MYKRIFLLGPVRDISQMAKLSNESNSKICRYLSPESLISSRFLLILSRQQASLRASNCLICFFILGKRNHLVLCLEVSVQCVAFVILYDDYFWCPEHHIYPNLKAEHLSAITDYKKRRIIFSWIKNSKIDQ